MLKQPSNSERTAALNLTHQRAFYFKSALKGVFTAALCGALYTTICGWYYVQNEHTTISHFSQWLTVAVAGFYGMVIGGSIGVPVGVATAVTRTSMITILYRTGTPGQLTCGWIVSCLLFITAAGYCWTLPEWGSHGVTIIQSGSFLSCCILSAGIATQLFTFISMQRIERHVSSDPIHLN